MRKACNLVKIYEFCVNMIFDGVTIKGHKMVINLGFKV
jgi:hypothetical protein